jgi:hypothetical protein
MSSSKKMTCKGTGIVPLLTSKTFLYKIKIIQKVLYKL